MEQVMEVLKKVFDWIAAQDWEGIFNKVVDVVTKIVEWVKTLG